MMDLGFKAWGLGAEGPSQAGHGPRRRVCGLNFSHKDPKPQP